MSWLQFPLLSRESDFVSRDVTRCSEFDASAQKMIKVKSITQQRSSEASHGVLSCPNFQPLLPKSQLCHLRTRQGQNERPHSQLRIRTLTLQPRKSRRERRWISQQLHQIWPQLPRRRINTLIYHPSRKSCRQLAQFCGRMATTRMRLTVTRTKMVMEKLQNEEIRTQTTARRRKKDTDKGKDGKEEQSRVVTDKGFPITLAGLEIFNHIITEQQKRDPDYHGMYIYNDYAGYGMTEVLENVLAEFNKILYKKDVSPLKKWSYIEGLGFWLFVGDLYSLMMNDNSGGIREIFNMFVPLMITGLKLLAEHSLIAPDSAIPNVNIFTLIVTEFLSKDAGDFRIKNVEKIVQAADEAGMVWIFPKGIKFGEEDVQKLRESCEARSKTPDWKREWPSFKRDHPGGAQYDITKMSEVKKRQYSFGGDDE
ncbi:hypothetical protein ONS96_005073 [Cadophora gregata f. sp. sojae]|nr:hypothetical protein ONS96_005073 [Cadophora gregata f. sp. sojae]